MRNALRIVTGAVIAGSISLACGLVAVPAQAAGAACPDYKLCLYKDANFSGRIGTLDGGYSYAPLRNFYYDGTFDTLDDSISSVVNNLHVVAYFNKDGNGQGESLLIPIGSSMAKLGSFNDKTSAINAYRSPQQPALH